MIEAGKYLCPECGRLSSKAFYSCAGNRTGAILFRKHLFGGYGVASFVAGGHEEADAVRYELANKKIENGLPDYIEVEEKREGKELRMERACPECKTQTWLPNGYGLTPTYVIAITGSTGMGKTAWLKAISTAENIAKLNDCGYPYRLDTEYAHDRGEGSATNVYSQGDTRCLYIKDGDHTCATVLLRDFGGELFDLKRESPNREEENGLWRILRGSGETYHGPDAYLFFTDGSNPETRDRWEDAYRAIKRSRGQDEKLTMGIVMSHLDQMMHKNLSLCAEDGARVPLLTAHTFRPEASYRREELLPRIELEDTIVRQYSSLAKSVGQAQTAKSFLVKSCSSRKTDDGRIEEIRTGGINIYDPLIWVLNQLQIFPLG